MHDLFLFRVWHEGIYYLPPYFYCFVAVSYLYFGWFLICLVGSLAGFLFYLLFLCANSLGRGFCGFLLFNPFRALA